MKDTLLELRMLRAAVAMSRPLEEEEAPTKKRIRVIPLCAWLFPFLLKMVIFGSRVD